MSNVEIFEVFLMIIDITGIVLIPGNQGRDCPGNGENPEMECCCEECDYMMCCMEQHDEESCIGCTDRDCPHAQLRKELAEVSLA